MGGGNMLVARTVGLATFLSQFRSMGSAGRKARERRTQLGGFVGLAAIVAAVCAASCGPTDGVPFEDEAAMDDAEVRSSEHSSTVAEQTLSLAVEFPTDVPLKDASVIAKQALTMNDRVQVPATSVTNRLALTVWHDAQVGHLRGARAIVLKDRAKVKGDVKAGTTVTKGNGVTISGATTQNALPTLTTLNWSAKSPTASLGPVLVETGARVSLPPNTYGNLTIRPRGKLTLETGVYVFQNVLIEPQAELRINAPYGPVQLFAKGTFNHRGSVVSTDPLGTPQLIVGYLGTTAALIESPFVGAFIAPNADVRFQAAQPTGHQAFIHGKSITLDADTKVGPYLVDWVRIGGPTQYAPPPADTPVVAWPSNPVDIRIDVFSEPGDEVSVGGIGNTGGDTGSSGGAGVGGTGGSSGETGGSGGGGGGVSLPPAEPVTVTKQISEPLSFDLPPTYPVAGGVLANGTVEFSFQNGGGSQIVCTYRGGSSSALPVTQLEANLGRTMTFVSCSDGLGVNTRRTATTFSLTVNPAPGFPVSIEPPMIRHGGCGEIWEEMSPADTYDMATTFDWANQTKVAERDNENRPTLFPAWIYIRNEEDLLSLRKLRIHRLKRPIFPADLTKYDDRCGTFRNSGDGTGVFVNTLIPGAVYNKLIDAFMTTQVSGNREVFRAVILQTVPSEVRTPQGSLKLKALADAGFRYLSYEADPFGPVSEDQDAAVVELVTDVVTWVVAATQDVVSAIGQGIAELDKVLRGRYPVRFDIHAANRDFDFIHDVGGRPVSGDVVSVHGWGPFAGYPLAANGMQVTLLQWTAFLPNETVARTDMTGVARMDIIRGGDLRTISPPLPLGFGHGVCIEYTSEGAKIVDFVGDSSSCDFRALRPGTGVSVPGGETINDQLDFSFPSSSIVLKVDDARYNNFVQLEDSYQYTKNVVGHNVKRVSALGGTWAATLSLTRGGAAFAPCMTFPNVVKDAIVGLAAGNGAIVGSVAGPLGSALSGLAYGVVANIFIDHDIVLPDSARLGNSRKKATHEYGHFLFCSLAHERNASALDYIIWQTILHPNRHDPVRYINEGFADFFAGQVAGGADYAWIQQPRIVAPNTTEVVPGVTPNRHCRTRRPPVWPSDPGDSEGPLCFDANLDGRNMFNDANFPTGTEQIGRVVTLIHDAFDGNPAFERQGYLPGNADAWDYVQLEYANPDTRQFVLSTPTYASTDSDLEHVFLPGEAIRDFVGNLAEGLRDFSPPESFGVGEPLDDLKLYRALSDTMTTYGMNWCERCRVLGLHDYKQGNQAKLRDVFTSCINNYSAELRGYPPVSLITLDEETCGACPPGMYADENQECVNGCPSDYVLDGASLGVETTSTIHLSNSALSFDPCPETFVLRVINFSSIPTDQSTSFTVRPTVQNAANCTVPFTLNRTLTRNGTVGSLETYQGTGSYVECLPTDPEECLETGGCTGIPSIPTTPGSNVDSVEFRSPVFDGWFDFHVPGTLGG